MTKKSVLAIMGVLLACAAFWIGRPRVASAQYEIGGSPIKKSWGAIRGTYVDPKGELRMVFEDQVGTVRIVAINPGVKTAVPLAEFKRQ